MDVAVDVGGTFTDFVVMREDTIDAFKLPSTPSKPEKVLLKGLEGQEVTTVGHGTTLATNAVIEGKGAPTALVTTAGFEDLLIIGRQRRPRLYDLRSTRPRDLVAREATFGLQERLDSEGRVLKPLTEEEVAALIDRIKALGIQSVAVSLLFSFLNPEHENLVGSILGEHFHISLSSRVLPEFREYERTSTTVLDALVGPLVRGYLSRLEEGLKARLFIMRSNGGVREARSLMRRPVEMLLSGPAGGVAGAKFVADTMAIDQVMTLDMGGTSADISILQDGQPSWTTEADIGGHPLALPALDISTIGAGGGSVAWMDSGGALRVGPQSAGADPGPMCYDRGGCEPTLTDVDLLSGYLGKALIGGKMPLDERLARKGVDALSRDLGLKRDEALMGVRDVVVSNMARAAAFSLARRGLDQRDFALVAFGGAGPMHALEVARDLDIPLMVVPPIPGAFSAYGILVSDLRLDYGRSLLRPLEGSLEDLEGVWQDLELEASHELEAQSFPREEALVLRSLDLRYRGQSYEIYVPFSDDVESDFHSLHQARYGYSMEGEPVVVVNVRLTALVRRPKPLPKLPTRSGGDPGSRRVLFEDGWTEVPVYSRDQLAPGFETEGPLIVEEETATTVLDPEGRLRVDDLGCLRIEVS
ncbi:MAG: hydantoinase/oxoprolinase family protein [Thermoplasmata archaeon]